MAWSVPMAALGLTQIVDVGGALWGGGAQVLVLFAAAIQTLWLSIAKTRRLARLLVEGDPPRDADSGASELAGSDPLTNILTRADVHARTPNLSGQRHPSHAHARGRWIDVT